jgi:hypothetical protein
MSKKSEAVKAMDSHYRYSDCPTHFKREFALKDLTARTAKPDRPITNKTCRQRTLALNKKLMRIGRPDLLVTVPIHWKPQGER